MTEIILTRGKVYGHEMAYAADAAGTRLGRMNLGTGKVTVEAGSDRDEVDAALRGFARTLDDPGPFAVASEPLAAPDAPVMPTPEPTPTWTDLAANRPGEGVQAEADAAWETSRQGSKFFSFTNRYIFDIKTDERAWRVGAEGERAIGERLNKLRDQGWRVLHSIPVGSRGSDIDHVVVGPGGVFTINSKNHPGGKIWVAKYQMRVNGHVVPYLRNARHEATRASKLLSALLGYEVPVRSCVVVLTGTIVPEVNIKEMPDDVMVLDRMDVPRWFKKRKPVLTAEQVENIYDVARRSTTWKPVS